MTRDDFNAFYKLKHEEIDKQHWSMFEHIQKVLDYYSSDHDKEILSNMITDFEEAVRYHFDYEIDLMNLSGYDVANPIDYNNHITEHLYTLMEIRGFGLRQRVEFPEPYPIRVIVNILQKHVIAYDQMFVNWFNLHKAE